MPVICIVCQGYFMKISSLNKSLELFDFFFFFFISYEVCSPKTDSSFGRCWRGNPHNDNLDVHTSFGLWGVVTLPNRLLLFYIMENVTGGDRIHKGGNSLDSGGTVLGNKAGRAEFWVSKTRRKLMANVLNTRHSLIGQGLYPEWWRYPPLLHLIQSEIVLYSFKIIQGAVWWQGQGSYPLTQNTSRNL